MNLGYSYNMTLGKQKPKITTNRSMIKKTFTEKGIASASRVGNPKRQRFSRDYQMESSEWYQLL